MKTVSISGSLRKNVGKQDAKKQRKANQIPCVIYGINKQIYFTLYKKVFEKFVYSPEIYFFEINIDGIKHKAIIQEMQFHPVTDDFLHVDFLEFDGSKPITMGVPIWETGTAVGITKGGMLKKKMRKISVKAFPEFMPDEITVDITSLEINDSIHISDLPQENIEYIAKPQQFVLGVSSTRIVEEEEEEESEEGEEGEEGETPEEGGEKKE